MSDTLTNLKSKVFDYVNTRLGGNLVDVELNAPDYEVAYEQAILTYRQRAQNAYEEAYNFITLQSDLTHYTLPQEIYNVRQIFRRTIGFAQGPFSQSFDPFSSAIMNTYLLNFNYSGGLATYDFYQQYVELAARMFGGYINYTWNPVTKRLQLIRDPRGNDEVVLLWTYNLRPEMVLLSDYQISQWFRDCMVGAAKIIIGEAREKFTNIAGPQGGGSLNGTAMKQEGMAQIEKSIEELRLYVDGSQPLTFVIG